MSALGVTCMLAGLALCACGTLLGLAPFFFGLLLIEASETNP